MVARVNGSFATSAVPGTRFTDVRWVAETGSTNQDLLTAAAAGADEGLVLVADHQSAGRGRLDRAWIAPPGASLLVSALLRPHVAADELFVVTLACGVAALEAVEEVTGQRLALKWPNDLVVPSGPAADRKVAGILAESHVAGGVVDAVVVGMGLNLDWPEDLPTEIAATAASVNHLTGGPVDREAVLVAWLRHYDRLLGALGDAGQRAALLDHVRSASATIGRGVRIQDAHETYEALAVDLDDAGRLLVERDGRIVTVTAGDVVHAGLVPPSP